MRDVKRLDGFYDKVKEIHAQYFPDWRFGQFMTNFLSAYGDPFFWEEDEFLKRLDEYAKAVVNP